MTTLTVNVTEKQKKEIEDYVNSKNIDLSEFIINLIFDKLEKENLIKGKNTKLNDCISEDAIDW